MHKILDYLLNTKNSLQIRNEISLNKIPSPKNLGSKSYAISAEVKLDETADPITYGKMIFLQDEDNQEDWGNIVRIILMIEADIEANMAADSLLPEVTWSWIKEALENQEATYTTLRGTVTVTNSKSFDNDHITGKVDQLELRCSWSPLTQNDYAQQINSFCSILSSISGLPPEGVPSINIFSKTHE